MAKPAIWGCSNFKKPKENEVKIEILDAQDNVFGATTALGEESNTFVDEKLKVFEDVCILPNERADSWRESTGPIFEAQKVKNLKVFWLKPGQETP